MAAAKEKYDIAGKGRTHEAEPILAKIGLIISQIDSEDHALIRHFVPSSQFPFGLSRMRLFSFKGPLEC